MIRELNKRSLVYGVQGVFLQAFFLYPPTALIGLIGSALLIIGLGYYAKAKGHSGYYGWLGLLSWFGVLVLLALKDRHVTPEETQARSKTRPQNVVLGILLGLALVIGVPLIIAMMVRLFARQ